MLSQMVVAVYYKKALMAVFLCIVLFAGGGSAGGQGPEERFEYFNDFIVYLKDNQRKDRILVCDVVVELNQGMKLPQERIELRKIIYNTLKEPYDLCEIRRNLKEKIKIGLNNFMSDEIIKNVYFTKFILL